MDGIDIEKAIIGLKNGTLIAVPSDYLELLRNKHNKSSERITELEAENKRLRAIKCPPISDGDICICPIENLESENKTLKDMLRKEGYEFTGFSGIKTLNS